MKKYLKYILPPGMMRHIRNWRIIEKNLLFKRIYSELTYISPYPKEVEKPPGHTILVLSPHMDDDIMGCGGTLHKHFLAGDKVISLYLVGRDKIRQKESRKASEIIGIGDLRFWDYDPHELKSDSFTVNGMLNLLKKVKPDTIYLPHPLDNHPDHYTTVKILFEALKRIRGRIEIYCYEIWTPMVPNVVVDISDYIGCKKKALEAFSSQLEEKDIPGATLGLNRYRSLFLKGKGAYAECFLALPSHRLKDFLETQEFKLDLGRS